MSLLRSMRSALLAALIMVSMAAFRISAADETDDEKAHAAESLTLAQRAAMTYGFSTGEKAGKPERTPEPVLRWTNPILGEVYGETYLWISQGRPVVAASFVKWYRPYTHRTHEFQSLATGPITGERAGNTVWTCDQAGVQLAPIPDAPDPGSTPALRLRQMRTLARQFTGRQTDRTGVERDMRLLAQPLYRYERTQGDPIDGALFVFALGTDPDAFLLIEERSSEGKDRWHYALARMTALQMRVSYRDREVWEAPALQGQQFSHGEAYTTFSNQE